jgi:hypothetical protein
MDDNPHPLQSEHPTPGLQIEPGVCFLGVINSPNPTECIAPSTNLRAGLVPGIRRGTEPHELRHPTGCAGDMCVAKPTLWIHHDALWEPTRRTHIAHHCIVQMRWCKASFERRASKRSANPLVPIEPIVAPATLVAAISIGGPAQRDFREG